MLHRVETHGSLFFHFSHTAAQNTNSIIQTHQHHYYYQHLSSTMMNFPTLANMGVGAVKFLLLYVAVQFFIVDPLLKQYQKQIEHDPAGPQANQGALVPAPNAAAANANAPLAIADGRAPRLIQKGIHVLFSLLVHMTVGFPSFLLELVSELAKVLPIQGIHGIWTALCLHYDNACRIIVLLGRDTSSFIGLVYQHPIAILLVILCFGATYLGSFVLASNRALVARVNPPPVHELPAFVVANAPSYMLALLERKETEENYENRIVSSFSVVFEVMPFLIYFLILFLTMSFLPVNMRRGAAIVSIALQFIMWLPHLLTMSWIERKSSYPFLLSLTDALMTGPLMESNHGFFYQYRQMYPIVMLILFTIYSVFQSIFYASCRCSLSLYMSMNSVLCCTLNYMFGVLVAGFSHYGFTNVVLYASAAVMAKFFIFEGIGLFIDLGTIMDWIFFQHSAGFFLVAILYYVGVFHAIFFLALYCGLRVHLSPPDFRDLLGSYVGDFLCRISDSISVWAFLLVVTLFYGIVVLFPCQEYFERNFPFRQLNMPRSAANGMIALTQLLNLYIFLFASAVFYFRLINAFMPGPLRETTSPIAFWLRQHGVISHFIDFFFG